MDTFTVLLNGIEDIDRAQTQNQQDPLRAEYDKVKGELELGNDNPSIIKQLKSLSVDMYSNRLISDSDFKDIVVRLVKPSSYSTPALFPAQAVAMVITLISTSSTLKHHEESHHS
ncbi:unnamed protein product [Phytophthora lilii]|uniref:Unnamed protein product n=1 Tax=Phytophthora lilii TaxID=2077276 RepID=A0A9W6TKW9_9STRA|nr:unnamed protein product [Phytophthora lilii]